MPLTDTQRAKKVAAETAFQEVGRKYDGMRDTFRWANFVDKDPDQTFTDAQLAARYNPARDALEAAARAMPRVGG